jgi:PhnB protein
MAFHPYLFFSGTCREAFTRYHQVFGGDLVLLPMSEAPSDQPVPPEQADLIMHAALTFGDDLLMGSDDPTGDGGPMRGVAVSYTTKDMGEATRVFDGLAEGGTVTMPLGETFFSPRFGMCVDRFNVPWMVNVEPPAAA